VSDRRLAVSLRQTDPMPLAVEFTCDPGGVLAIFGPSGSGKTTILRSIAGLFRPQYARVQSGDDVWTDTGAGIDCPPHRRAVGFVFQEYALFPHLTALGNVITALGHRAPAERLPRAEALLALVHLSDQASRRPSQLSGGERQRVALARALAREPAVLLLDEPFAAVDRPVRRRLQNEIDDIRRTLDIPLVLVTHDFEDVVRLATHVLVLDRGRAVASGPLGSLMSRPDLSFLRDAIGLGSVFEAVVSEVDGKRGLLSLTFDGGRLLVPRRELAIGTTVRVRIPAREVILASTAPEGLSLHNRLTGTVAAIHAEPTLDEAVVQVAVGNLLLLAEVTRDAVDRLQLAAGRPVHALIKSVSVNMPAAGERRGSRLDVEIDAEP
jgi:molybdate transport system ATP-binding protein